MYKSLLTIICLLFPVIAFAQTPVENYPEDPASVEHAGVPRGEIIKVTFENSKIYPGTWREYSIYVPAQYDPAKPACVWVNQDGIQFKAPTVFDNLINSKEMPVTIGVFVTPGQVRAADEMTALNRYNRSFEYDGLGDAYACFILEEILPDVEKHKTKDGRAIHLSTHANDRGIGGSSSGAIAAFNAAWERPDAFSRVFSSIGTYTALRGADRVPSLIRKYEAKPIRVFLQDGSNDLNIYAGDWFKANEMMERSLKFAGYQVQAIYGEGGHNGKMATAYFPQAMRFLWKDHPQPVTTSPSKNDMLKAITIPGQDWELVSDHLDFLGKLVSNANGEVFARNVGLNEGAVKISADGRVEAVAKMPKYDQDIRITAKNRSQYRVAAWFGPYNKLVAKLPNGKSQVVKIRFNPGAMALTPDQSQLYIADFASHWIWLYRLNSEGAPVDGQRYGWLYTPDDADAARTTAMQCDTAGRVYVATNMGIQVLDQVGRVNAIFPLPGRQVESLCFGGANFDMLYVLCRDKLYRRKLNTKGINSWDALVKPAKPKL
ncbi:SMP-30/gluconolactonase/LRE family protein [Mucilaginibacter mali]|uniref:SMP-30/gluconolactonase/LRE family protein n=1 Tax=Mucilaginibacter mali TaxID=2740462 RepID=A0A7D4QDY3_9SPHI|nr:SMP-30/gluconolactonase/LRE family protein [Mucilaginibacter mali]QKJ29292.1 SMP-30/gluconolactonase/LRE family protein [Mucilaginibacter mali]